MGDVTMALLICLVFVAFLIITMCHYFDLVPWLRAWLISNREEKIGLTLLRGHYHPNGYLVHSDSDVQLGSNGSFKRFDSIDRDFKIAAAATATYMNMSGGGEVNSDWTSNNHQQQQQQPYYSNHHLMEDLAEYEIPPQPLRPAPAPTPVGVTGQPLTAQQPFPVVATMQETQQADREIDCRQGIPKKGIIHSTTAPVIISSSTTTNITDGTSIRPIPRPVSSVNMTGLLHQSSPNQNPFISPLPPPPAIATTSLANTSDSQDHQDPVGVVVSGVPAATYLKRAVSCESVCSDTSVALESLEASNITGYLCLSLEYDSEHQEMSANILEAKDLVPPATLVTDNPMDTYIRIFLLPDKTTNIQTKIIRSSNSPSFKERVLFNLHPRDQSTRSLSFHIYSVDSMSHSLIGEGELKLSDVTLRQPVTTWITLTDTGQRGTEFGEVMFSLSYLPTAERLTVVVVKARNLKFANEKEMGDPFVKVYLLQNGKKMHKKKTSTKKSERCPIFNEAMIFSVPAHNLQTIQLRLTVAEPSNRESVKAYPIGHVIVGAQAAGRSLNHWNQMLTALRKPVAMWHTLRK